MIFFGAKGEAGQVHFDSRAPHDEIIVECDEADADAAWLKSKLSRRGDPHRHSTVKR
jgi:hypothetical protein